MSIKADFETADKIHIAGDFYQGTNGMPAFLLLHMMPATKESWVSFAEKALISGFSVLAIDLRGHGESGEGPDGYKFFADEDHQKSFLDIEAATGWLHSNGFNEIYLGGASIGANLSLCYAAKNNEIKKIFLLSPGLDYRGVKTEACARALDAGQSVYFVGDEKDMRSSGSPAAIMARRLFDLTSAKKEIKMFNDGLHGTDMLEKHKDMEDEILRWLKLA